MKASMPLILATASLLSTSLHANIKIAFVESAPKDRFVITNSSECSHDSLRVKIDLSQSAGRLIFDTTELGDGVEVFQPFETGDDNVTLVGSATVKDGQSSLELLIEGLGPEKSVSFTIDVDDTLVKSELGNIRVSRSEMQGATVSVGTEANNVFSGTFGDDAKVEVVVSGC